MDKKEIISKFLDEAEGVINFLDKEIRSLGSDKDKEECPLSKIYEGITPEEILKLIEEAFQQQDQQQEKRGADFRGGRDSILQALMGIKDSLFYITKLTSSDLNCDKKAFNALVDLSTGNIFDVEPFFENPPKNFFEYII